MESPPFGQGCNVSNDLRPVNGSVVHSRRIESNLANFFYVRRMDNSGEEGNAAKAATEECHIRKTEGVGLAIRKFFVKYPHLVLDGAFLIASLIFAFLVFSG